MIETYPRRSGWYDFFGGSHSDPMLGVPSDLMLATAAPLTLFLIATGLYMWWPRKAGWCTALAPSFGKGCALKKSWHGVVGMRLSLFLMFFLISGLAWAEILAGILGGILGGKMVQVWSQFPVEKWENVPLSDETHASMTPDRRELT